MTDNERMTDDILSDEALNDLIDEINASRQIKGRVMDKELMDDLSDLMQPKSQGISEGNWSGSWGDPTNDEVELEASPADPVPSDKQRNKDAYRKSMGII